jgi:hypothetical protein
VTDEARTLLGAARWVSGLNAPHRLTDIRISPWGVKAKCECGRQLPAPPGVSILTIFRWHKARATSAHLRRVRRPGTRHRVPKGRVVTLAGRPAACDPVGSDADGASRGAVVLSGDGEPCRLPAP